ncbi:hypothetical protein [Rhodoferax fermentans]|uniref:hypothetical protein n=1 Tax=Rhodoferax fermentans TaxID=28066 RepID=UPI001301B492|nr:hypothetical protein [Rhodoferax fermentans]
MIEAALFGLTIACMVLLLYRINRSEQGKDEKKLSIFSYKETEASPSQLEGSKGKGPHA